MSATDSSTLPRAARTTRSRWMSSTLAVGGRARGPGGNGGRDRLRSDPGPRPPGSGGGAGGLLGADRRDEDASPPEVARKGTFPTGETSESIQRAPNAVRGR
jgi:hypothetical protein